MKKNITGLILLIHPVIIYSLFSIYSLEYFWYFDKNHQAFDLIYSIFSFILFITGINLTLNKRKHSLIIALTSIFIIYQILSWGFQSKRSLSGIEIDQKYSLYLIPNDGGAFTSTSLVKLKLIEKKYLLFITKGKEINSYENIFSAKFMLEKNQIIDITLTTYSNEVISDSIDIDPLLDSLYN